MVPTIFFALAATACGRRQSGGLRLCCVGEFCWRLAAFFIASSPAPSPCPSASEILKVMEKGKSVGGADCEASASRRHADAAFQPLAGEFEDPFVGIDFYVWVL